MPKFTVFLAFVIVCQAECRLSFQIQRKAHFFDSGRAIGHNAEIYGVYHLFSAKFEKGHVFWFGSDRV